MGPFRAGLRAAEEAWRAASANYHEVMSQVEAAYMDGRGNTPEVDAMSRAAFVRYGEALAEVVAAREAIPTFEDMLAHPWTQVDPKSEVLASIKAYDEALPATAGLPVVPPRSVVLPSDPEAHSAEPQASGDSL